jgi:putative ABC transport system permease protein
MNAIWRGVRNTFRNTTRTVAVVLIVAVILALAVSMFVSHQAASDSVQSVSSNLGTTVVVSPAGTYGGFGGGNPLTSAQVAEVAATKNVVSVAASVTGRLSSPGDTSSGFYNRSGGTTSLTSPLTIGSIGQHQGGFSGGGGGGGFTPPNPDTPLPITVLGTTSPLDPATYGADTVSITSGTAIDASSSKDVADVGSTLASKNDLSVGSTFTAYSTTITVVGIYTTNETFANAEFIVPLRTEEALSGIDGVTSVVATVNSLGNVQSTATAIQDKLGSSVANVTTAQTNSSGAASQLSSIKSIALFSLVGAVIAAVAILLMSMLMIVRERRREIGILKAFGSSNGGIVASFVSEAMTLTLLAAVVGTVLGVVLSNPILSALESGTKSSPSGGFRGFGGGGGGFARFSNFGVSGISHLHAVFGGSLVLYCVLVVIGIALIGSAVPAYAIAKVRPAEVLRSE